MYVIFSLFKGTFGHFTCVVSFTLCRRFHCSRYFVCLYNYHHINTIIYCTSEVKNLFWKIKIFSVKQS